MLASVVLWSWSIGISSSNKCPSSINMTGFRSNRQTNQLSKIICRIGQSLIDFLEHYFCFIYPRSHEVSFKRPFFKIPICSEYPPPERCAFFQSSLFFILKVIVRCYWAVFLTLAPKEWKPETITAISVTVLLFCGLLYFWKSGCPNPVKGIFVLRIVNCDTGFSF